MKYQVRTPETYLSFNLSTKKCRIIHQGMPLCVDKDGVDDVLPVLTQFRLLMASIGWDADNGRWVWLPPAKCRWTDDWARVVEPTSTTRYCEEMPENENFALRS